MLPNTVGLPSCHCVNQGLKYLKIMTKCQLHTERDDGRAEGPERGAKRRSVEGVRSAWGGAPYSASPIWGSGGIAPENYD